MAWTDIPNTDLDQDSPITQTLMTALRDNDVAIKNFISSTDLSNDATADFTDFDSSLYDNYLFILNNVIPATDNVAFYMRTSTDGGASYDSGASEYGWVGNRKTFSASPAAADIGSGGDTQLFLTLSFSSSNNVGSGAGEDGVSGLVWLCGPHLAARSNVDWNINYVSSGGTSTSVRGHGYRDSAADIDAVRFLFSSGNLESGTITMYGFGNQ